MVAHHRHDRDPAAGAAPRPWWTARSSRRNCPLGTLSLLGGAGSWSAPLLTIALLSLLVLTRVLAFPNSIWDQDEAYLGLAVIDFDPADNRPHPPWFPAWVAAGRLVAPLCSQPTDGLRVLSSVASVWTVFPLTALFGIWLRRDLALASALLYLSLPGPWFLAGRSFSDTPATFLLVLTAAWWLRPDPSRSDLVRGSLAGGLCLLVRPQLALPVLGLLVWRLWACRGRGLAVRVAGPLLVVVGIGAVGLVVASGGVAPLADAWRVHAEYQLSGLDPVELSLRDSGPARALIRPEAAVVWIVLAVVGCAVWARGRAVVGSPLPLVVAVVAPLVVTVAFLTNPEITRYALPLLAFTSGPVVVAVAAVAGRLAFGLVALAVTASLTAGVPQALAYRSRPSPVVAALTLADELAVQTGSTLVVERTLLSFADYLAVSDRLRSDVVVDFSIEIGAVESPDPSATVAVFPGRRAGFVRTSEYQQDISCPMSWMLRLESDRFLDVGVAAGAHLEPGGTRW